MRNQLTPESLVAVSTELESLSWSEHSKSKIQLKPESKTERFQERAFHGWLNPLISNPAAVSVVFNEILPKILSLSFPDWNPVTLHQDLGWLLLNLVHRHPTLATAPLLSAFEGNHREKLNPKLPYVCKVMILPALVKFTADAELYRFIVSMSSPKFRVWAIRQCVAQRRTFVVDQIVQDVLVHDKKHVFTRKQCLSFVHGCSAAGIAAVLDVLVSTPDQQSFHKVYRYHWETVLNWFEVQLKGKPVLKWSDTWDQLSSKFGPLIQCEISGFKTVQRKFIQLLQQYPPLACNHEHSRYFNGLNSLPTDARILSHLSLKNPAKSLISDILCCAKRDMIEFLLETFKESQSLWTLELLKLYEFCMTKPGYADLVPPMVQNRIMDWVSQSSANEADLSFKIFKKAFYDQSEWMEQCSIQELTERMLPCLQSALKTSIPVLDSLFSLKHVLLLSSHANLYDLLNDHLLVRGLKMVDLLIKIVTCRLTNGIGSKKKEDLSVLFQSVLTGYKSIASFVEWLLDSCLKTALKLDDEKTRTAIVCDVLESVQTTIIAMHSPIESLLNKYLSAGSEFDFVGTRHVVKDTRYAPLVDGLHPLFEQLHISIFNKLHNLIVSPYITSVKAELASNLEVESLTPLELPKKTRDWLMPAIIRYVPLNVAKIWIGIATELFNSKETKRVKVDILNTQSLTRLIFEYLKRILLSNQLSSNIIHPLTLMILSLNGFKYEGKAQLNALSIFDLFGPLISDSSLIKIDITLTKLFPHGLIERMIPDLREVFLETTVHFPRVYKFQSWLAKQRNISFPSSVLLAMIDGISIKEFSQLPGTFFEEDSQWNPGKENKQVDSVFEQVFLKYVSPSDERIHRYFVRKLRLVNQFESRVKVMQSYMDYADWHMRYNQQSVQEDLLIKVAQWIQPTLARVQWSRFNVHHPFLGDSIFFNYFPETHLLKREVPFWQTSAHASTVLNNLQTVIRDQLKTDMTNSSFVQLASTMENSIYERLQYYLFYRYSDLTDQPFDAFIDNAISVLKKWLQFFAQMRYEIFCLQQGKSLLFSDFQPFPYLTYPEASIDLPYRIKVFDLPIRRASGICERVSKDLEAFFVDQYHQWTTDENLSLLQFESFFDTLRSTVIFTAGKYLKPMIHALKLQRQLSFSGESNRLSSGKITSLYDIVKFFNPQQSSNAAEGLKSVQKFSKELVDYLTEFRSFMEELWAHPSTVSCSPLNVDQWFEVCRILNTTQFWLSHKRAMNPFDYIKAMNTDVLRLVEISPEFLYYTKVRDQMMNFNQQKLAGVIGKEHEKGPTSKLLTCPIGLSVPTSKYMLPIPKKNCRTFSTASCQTLCATFLDGLLDDTQNIAKRTLCAKSMTRSFSVIPVDVINRYWVQHFAKPVVKSDDGEDSASATEDQSEINEPTPETQVEEQFSLLKQNFNIQKAYLSGIFKRFDELDAVLKLCLSPSVMEDRQLFPFVLEQYLQLSNVVGEESSTKLIQFLNSNISELKKMGVLTMKMIINLLFHFGNDGLSVILSMWAEVKQLHPAVASLLLSTILKASNDRENFDKTWPCIQAFSSGKLTLTHLLITLAMASPRLVSVSKTPQSLFAQANISSKFEEICTIENAGDAVQLENNVAERLATEILLPLSNLKIKDDFNRAQIQAISIYALTRYFGMNSDLDNLIEQRFRRYLVETAHPLEKDSKWQFVPTSFQTVVSSFEILVASREKAQNVKSAKKVFFDQLVLDILKVNPVSETNLLGTFSSLKKLKIILAACQIHIRNHFQLVDVRAKLEQHQLAAETYETLESMLVDE